jgi:hypothetical protein
VYDKHTSDNVQYSILCRYNITLSNLSYETGYKKGAYCLPWLLMIHTDTTSAPLLIVVSKLEWLRLTFDNQSISRDEHISITSHCIVRLLSPWPTLSDNDSVLIFSDSVRVILLATLLYICCLSITILSHADRLRVPIRKQLVTARHLKFAVVCQRK